MKVSMPILLVLLGLNVHAADKAVSRDGDLNRLQGRWTAEAGTRHEIHVLIEIKGRGVCAAIKTPQGLDFHVQGELKLDETTSPRSLDWKKLIGPDQQPLPEIAAVYKIDGDTFTVCNGGFLGARPKEFKPGESVLADVVVFHRVDTKDTRTGSTTAPASPADTKDTRTGSTTAPASPVDTKDTRTGSMTAPASPVAAQQPSLPASSDSKKLPATGVEQVRPALLPPPVRLARRFWQGRRRKYQVLAAASLPPPPPHPPLRLVWVANP
jgi:uncharacterized protein (TIGR03067 family)